MKEVKYRAYVKHLKLIVQVEKIHFDRKEVEVISMTGSGGRDEFYFSEVDLMQFTGATDVKGQEVYTGNTYCK